MMSHNNPFGRVLLFAAGILVVILAFATELWWLLLIAILLCLIGIA
jgi:uncharacterized membrane protein